MKFSDNKENYCAFYMSNGSWRVAKVLEEGLEVSEFKLQSRYYDHFHTATRVQILDETDCISHSSNTFGKGMNPIILPPAMGK